MNLVLAAEGLDIWGDLGEVIVVGLISGVGLSIVFALTIRAFALETVARREGRRGEARRHAAVAVVFSLLSIAVIGGALFSMLHR